VVYSLKTWKNRKGVFWYSSARPRPFARFAQWLIRPWWWHKYTKQASSRSTLWSVIRLGMGPSTGVATDLDVSCYKRWCSEKACWHLFNWFWQPASLHSALFESLCAFFKSQRPNFDIVAKMMRRSTSLTCYGFCCAVYNIRGLCS